MTLDDIKERVADIEARAGDDEAQHCKEDDLHQGLLRHLWTMDLERDQDLAKEMIAEALKTLELDFHRWCA